MLKGAQSPDAMVVTEPPFLPIRLTDPSSVQKTAKSLTARCMGARKPVMTAAEAEGASCTSWLPQDVNNMARILTKKLAGRRVTSRIISSLLDGSEIGWELPCLLLPLPRVKRIPDAFTQQVIAAHRHEYGEAGEGGEPPGNLDVVLA